VIRLVFAVTICFGIWHWAGAAVAAGAKDCIALEDSEPEDALTYRNDCNRSVIFYYCVVDPKRSEVHDQRACNPCGQRCRPCRVRER
jgi:hypothetical protein